MTRQECLFVKVQEGAVKESCGGRLTVNYLVPHLFTVVTSSGAWGDNKPTNSCASMGELGQVRVGGQLVALAGGRRAAEA